MVYLRKDATLLQRVDPPLVPLNAKRIYEKNLHFLSGSLKIEAPLSLCTKQMLTMRSTFGQ